jgi:hypothetical protein
MKNIVITLCLFFACLHACLSTCQAQGGQEGAPLQITPATTHTLIDSLGQVLYNHYIFPDTARKWAAYLEAQYKKAPTQRSKIPMTSLTASSRTCKKPIMTAIFV